MLTINRALTYFFRVCRKNNISSGSDSEKSSRHEKSAKPFANVIRRRTSEKHHSKNASNQNETNDEMIGKCDESFIYEKETDILSDDTDPSEWNLSELDTGLDGGDEYDTDEILGNDYIATGSIQGFSDTVYNEDTGSYLYYDNRTTENQHVNLRRPHSTILESKYSKRRKRLTRTRKRNEKVNDSSTISQPNPVKTRGSRSVGGTPVSLRRNKSKDKLIL